MSASEENISAFAAQAAQVLTKTKKKKKKKQELSIKEFIGDKKKEANANGTKMCNSPVTKKAKRKYSTLSEDEDKLWNNFQNDVNPVKKPKKDLSKRIKNSDSLFENINVTNKSNNIFLKEQENLPKIKKKKKKENVITNNTLNTSSNAEMDSPDLRQMNVIIEKKKNKKNKLLADFSSLHRKKNYPLKVNNLNDKPVKKKKKLKKAKPKLNDDKEKAVPEVGRGQKLVLNSDSVKLGEDVLSWLLQPVTIEKFFSSIWEKQTLHVARNKEDYFSKICTLHDIDYSLKHHDMFFTKNIDVTSYTDGVRTTENPVGKARPHIVWDFFKNGRSIRLLNPQTFIQNVAVLTTTLQEFFRCFVGANIYLTPADSQGFAPHYDDIEAFVLQLEGEKQWRVYNPRCEEEKLPRMSSENFVDEEIGEPILEVTLKAGDLLYFPRGFIHQAKCVPGKHSLHITVSCYQRNTWADLLEKVIPVALDQAIREDVEFRTGLPIDYLDHLGLVHSDSKSENRQQVLQKFEKLMKKLIEYCPVDAGVDQLAKGLMHDAMPPCLTQEELDHSTGRAENISESHLTPGELGAHLDKPLGIKLIRANVLRLVAEEESLVVYYTTDNSKEYHGEDPMFFEIPLTWAQSIDLLVHSYPNFVQVKDLPLSESEDEDLEKRDIIDFVYPFWEKGLLLFDKPISELKKQPVV